MYQLGELHYDTLQPAEGSKLERNSKLAFRLLGFGHVMTEFAVAHLRIRETQMLGPLSLGALANLIVSAYDGLIDSGHDPERVLPRSRLNGAGKRASRGDPLITALVDLYFERLACLPHPHPPVRKTLQNAILRMYDAERATAGAAEFSPEVWRRKSALPFVIMGLPIWMTTPSFDVRACRAHLAWLYRLGQFFGWIDDAADLDADRAANRPNYFNSRPKRFPAVRVARHARRILDTWDAGAPRDRDTGTLRQTFLAIVWSWLGVAKTGKVSL